MAGSFKSLLVIGLAVTVSTTTWYLTKNYYEAKQAAAISGVLKEQAQATLKSLERAHDRTIEMQSRKDAAESLRAVTQQQHAAAVADLAAVRRLYNTTALSASERAKDSHASCLAITTTLTELHRSCEEALGELADKADKHADDNQTLIRAWPR